MTMTIATIMRLLNGTRVIKPHGPESKNKRKALTQCMASQSCNGLVHVRKGAGSNR